MTRLRSGPFEHWGLLAAVVVAAAVRAAFFAPVILLDDVYYIRAALDLALLGELTPTHFGTRLGLVGPTALAVRAFGSNVHSLTVLPFACSLATVVVAFAVGRRVAGARVAAYSATLMALFPLEVIFASHVFPCAVHALAAGLVLLCVLRAADDGQRRWLFLAGVALGAAYLARATALFCFVPAAYAIWALAPDTPHDPPRRLRRWLAHLVVFSGGALFVLLCELAFFGGLVGDPFYRLRLLTRAIAGQGTTDVIGAWVNASWWLRPPARALTEQEFGLYPLLAVVAGVVLARRHWRTAPAVRVLVVWVAFIFLYTYYGSVSPFRLAPLPRLPRYLATLSVPAIVLVAWWLQTLSVRARWVVVGVVALTSIACVSLDNGRAIYAHHRRLHAFLAERSEPVVLSPELLFGSILTGGCRDTLRVWLPEQHARYEDFLSTMRLCPSVGVLTTTAELERAASEGALFAVRAGQEASVPVLHGAETRVMVFHDERGLYHELLSNPWFDRLLSLTRDEYRMQGLRALATAPREELVVYRRDR